MEQNKAHNIVEPEQKTLHYLYTYNINCLW